MPHPDTLKMTVPLEVGIGCSNLATMRHFYEQVLGSAVHQRGPRAAADGAALPARQRQRHRRAARRRPMASASS